MTRHPARAKARKTSDPRGLTTAELAYERDLETRKRSGELVSYGWQTHKLKLEDRSGAKDSKAVWYTPDFTEVTAAGEIVHVEVKGWSGKTNGGKNVQAGTHRDSRLRLRLVAARYPEYRFVLVYQRPKRDGGGWVREEFSAECQCADCVADRVLP